MSEEIKNNENKANNAAPAATGEPANEKMFTQDDVNRIVSERLARDRESRAAQQQNDEKETALKAREARLDCREYVTEQKYPEALLDVLDTSDVDKFKETVEKLVDLFGYKKPRFVDPPVFTAPKGSHAPGQSDPLREAFKQKT